jgi:hypothetical protein
MNRFALCLVGLMIPAFASAAVDELTNINLYVANADYDLACDSFSDDGLVCGDLVSAPGSADGSFIWVVASHTGPFPDGIGGIQFGIQYSGDLFSIGWALCTGGSEIAQAGWPDSGTGDAVTWSGGCYVPTGEVAKIGYLTVLDATVGSFAIIGDPRLAPPDDVAWADCSAVVWTICPENRGSDDNVGDGTVPDCDSCPVTPLQEVSWGAIKSLF